MAYLNRVQLIGRLGADPEIRSLNNGDRVASLRLATTKKWKDKNSGDTREDTQWHSVDVWGEGLVSLADKHIRKGMEIMVEGELFHDTYEKDGTKTTRTKVKLSGVAASIQIITWNKDEGGTSQPRSSSPARSSALAPSDFPDDDIPFN